MRVDGYPCIFYGDLYGTKGDNPQEPVSQLDDLIRCRKLFAYGEQREYWDHRESSISLMVERKSVIPKGKWRRAAWKLRYQLTVE